MFDMGLSLKEKEILAAKNGMTVEQVERKAKKGKKIALFFFLPIVLLIIIIAVLPEDNSVANPKGLTDGDFAEMVGKLAYETRLAEFGSTRVLDNDNYRYVLQFVDSANVSYVATKANDTIVFAGLGDVGKVRYEEIKQERKGFTDPYIKKWQADAIQIIKDSALQPKTVSIKAIGVKDWGKTAVIRIEYTARNAYGQDIPGAVTVKGDYASGDATVE